MRTTLALLVAALAAAGCGESHGPDGGAAGDAATSDAGTDAGLPPGSTCEVATVPGGGFDPREIYIEVSASCGESCMVYQLDGDPRAGCSGVGCADPMDVADRVFCTCRCGGADPTADYCTCPTAMTCVADVVQLGSAAGDYCVNDRAL